MSFSKSKNDKIMRDSTSSGSLGQTSSSVDFPPLLIGSECFVFSRSRLTAPSGDRAGPRGGGMPTLVSSVAEQPQQASTGAFGNLASPEEKYVEMPCKRVEVELASMKATLNLMHVTMLRQKNILQDVKNGLKCLDNSFDVI